MSKFNSFLALLLKACKKDACVVVAFLLFLLQMIGTTSVLWLSHSAAGYFFAVVNIIATLLFGVLFLAVYLYKDE